MHSEVACKWLDKAEKDVKWAESMLDEGDLDYSAFHSQQAAEKALKALLTALGRQPPRTHDIEILIQEIRGQGVNTDTLEEHGADELTHYAVEARYPDFEEEITIEEAREALNLAIQVVGWVKDRLRELGAECSAQL